MLPPWCAADRHQLPGSDLPAATRAAAVSMPWSSELRTRCVSGSMMRSIRLLSSSVACAEGDEFDFLAELRREVAHQCAGSG